MHYFTLLHYTKPVFKHCFSYFTELRTKKAPCTLSSKTAPDSPRVKSTSSTSNISKDESSKTESKTSDTSSPKLPPDHCGEDVEAPSPDKNSGSLDNKNKRRKMENPRKRKRSISEHMEMDDGDKALNLIQNDPKASVIARNPKNTTIEGQNVDKCANKRRTDNPVTCQLNDNVTSSSPEDLSVKRSTRRSADRSIIQHSSTAFRNTLSPTADKHKSNSFLNIQDTSSSNQMSITGSSVKELEAAMNRHLPTSSTTTTFHSQNDKNAFENLTADSTGAVKTFSGITSSGVLANPQLSSTSWLPASSRHGTDMLTASNFLRSLYANRESVIKTNSRSQASFINNEPPTSLLLTPPEPDPSTYREQNNPYPYGKSDYSGHSYIYDKETGLDTRDMYKDQTNRDQFSFIPYKDHISTAYIDHISSAVYKDHLTSTYKELSPYKDIIPAFTIPSLMSPTGRMHQAYSSFHHHFTVPLPATNMDACSSITPPSSNSPDTNKHAPNSQQVDPTNYFTDANNACNLAQKQSMNNSLSPSSLSPATPSHHYHHPRHYIDHFYQGVNAVDAAKGGYYSIPSASGGSLYTDLNQNGSTPVQYETCTRPVIPWY